MDTGGIGDLIGTLPCIQYVYDKHPHVISHFWVPDYGVDLVKRSLPESYKIIVKGFAEKDKFKKEFYGRAFSIHKSTNLGYHITKQAFSVLINEEVDNEYLNYLPVKTDDVDISKFSLPEKYVCMTTGFTAPVREFLPHYVNQVNDYIIQRGYTPVFLGNEKTSNGAGHVINGVFRNEIDFTKGINLINKTSLIEAQKIMSNSKCVIGLDNGLCHLAATSEIPIVIGYTTVKPKHRMPYRHNELGWNVFPVLPPESIGCRFCQSNMQFTYHHDFKSCFYVQNKEDKEIQCIKQLTPMLYINELEKIL